MKDIDIAKEMLENEHLALAIVKEGKVIYSSIDKGIKPMYMAVKTIKEQLKGASVADKVIGRAAAMLCEYAEINELYTKLISENAIKILEKTSIKFQYEEFSPYIKNRNKTGLCPVESLSLKASNIDELLEGITDFLENISRGV